MLIKISVKRIDKDDDVVSRQVLEKGSVRNGVVLAFEAVTTIVDGVVVVPSVGGIYLTGVVVIAYVGRTGEGIDYLIGKGTIEQGIDDVGSITTV